MKETSEQAKKRHDKEVKHVRKKHKSDIDEMTERHAKEIDDLRVTCKHKKVSDWMPSMWAPGHYGPQVKTCENCGLVIDTEKWDLGDIVIESGGK